MYHLSSKLCQLAGIVEYNNTSVQRVKTPTNECPRYDIKQSDCEAPVMLELWGMKSTHLLPFIPDSLWPWIGST